MNLALAPRSKECSICKRVSMIEDVTMRCFEADGRRRRGYAAAVSDYLASIGDARSDSARRNAATRHVIHVERWAAGGGAIAPMQIEARRIEEPENANWLSVQQAGMDIGMDALRSLKARMDSGELEPRHEIALAKLGIVSAGARGALEARGKGIRGLDKILHLASGLE